jgi:hypothetical protein
MRAFLILAAALLLVTSPILGQQKYVTRFDLVADYAFLDSRAISLFENGFQFQICVRSTTWYSLGFDYSISAGNGTLTPNLLTPALQQQLGAQLAELIKEGRHPSHVHVKPADSFQDTDLCRRSATRVSSLLEADPIYPA